MKASTLDDYKQRMLRVLVHIQRHLGEDLSLKLGETYTKLLGQWLPRSGYGLRSSPCFEIYLNSPENTEPEDLITDIYAPLLPKGALQ